MPKMRLAAVLRFCICNCSFLFVGSVLHAQFSSAKGTKTKVADSAAVVFENIIKQSKVDFKLRSSISPQRYSIETMTGGVAVFDYDNDGFLDLFFSNGATIPGPLL